VSGAHLRAALLTAGLCAILGPWPPAHASAKQTINVFAAASLSGAFADVARAFEQQHPAVSVRFNFTGSQQLAAQIEQGAQADVFASADDRWLEHVRARGLITGSPLTFARNRLVFIVPKTNPGRIRRLQDMTKGGLKIVIGADAVPVGHYTRTLLSNLSRTQGFPQDFSARVLANVVSEEENVKSIVGKVQLGEADAGVVYGSDVTPGLSRYVRSIEIPEGANVVASYPIATLKSAQQPDDARAFVALVLSDEGQRILAHWAFLPATQPSR
jgi:molybdate transport system substrate-binding protein